MLKNLNREVLDELLRAEEGLCLSIFVPTRTEGPPTARGELELESSLRGAEDLLAAEGVGPSASAWLLAPVRDLLHDDRFWQAQGEGLAIFVSPERVWTIRLSKHPEAEVRFGRRFALGSLLPMLPPVERFYLLALSLNRPRLVEVRPGATHAVVLPGWPAGMREALGYEKVDTELQTHSAGPRSLGRSASIVHGHGAGDAEHAEDDVLRYFRLVAEAARSRPDYDAPIVLACVGEHVPLFRRAAPDLPLLEAFVPGSPDHVADGELATRAWALVADSVRARRDDALTRYRELVGRRTADDPAEVVTAAEQGRVDTLFFVPGEHRWGHLGTDGTPPEIHPNPEAGDDDLVDLAVSMSLTRGGKVYPVPVSAVPGHQPMAAILRY